MPNKKSSVFQNAVSMGRGRFLSFFLHAGLLSFFFTDLPGLPAGSARSLAKTLTADGTLTKSVHSSLLSQHNVVAL